MHRLPTHPHETRPHEREHMISRKHYVHHTLEQTTPPPLTHATSLPFPEPEGMDGWVGTDAQKRAREPRHARAAPRRVTPRQTAHHTLHYLSALRVTRGMGDLIHDVAMSVSTDRRGRKAHNKRGHEHEGVVVGGGRRATRGCRREQLRLAGLGWGWRRE